MGVPFTRGVPFMQYAIVADTWASFSRTVAAAAIGLWLAFAICPAVFAADGRQAAAAAKETAANRQAYLRDLEKSKGQPEYSKPPAVEFLKRIFAADALAALPAPKADDIGWLLEWVVSADQAYIAMLMFGAKDSSDQPAGRNLVDYQDHTMPAAAFRLRLYERIARTVPSLPPDKRKQERETSESRPGADGDRHGWLYGDTSQTRERASDRSGAARYCDRLGATSHCKGTR